MFLLSGGQLNIEYGSTCQFDYVKITDGDGTTLMDNSCGSSSLDPSNPGYFQPSTITTRTNTVEIFFHTDASGTRPGWSLSWIAVTPGSKEFIQTASVSFFLLNCHWHFLAWPCGQMVDFGPNTLALLSSSRVAGVARTRERRSPKSLVFDENFKPYLVKTG